MGASPNLGWKPYAYVLIAGGVLFAVFLVSFKSAVRRRQSWRQKAVSSPSSVGEGRYYDLVGLIYATASKKDQERMDRAVNTWLSEFMEDIVGTFTYVFVICADDPNIHEVYGRSDVAIVPCVNGYETLVTKGIEGYRYISKHYRFKYVIKADVDVTVDLDCVMGEVYKINRTSCPSFGFGRWYPEGWSQVWRKTDMPYGLKFHNDNYLADTGFKYYPPYMSGWAFVWSGDVANVLGMYGNEMPKWRSSWRIDDSAIGTFVVGLDMCRISCSRRCFPVHEHVQGVPEGIGYDDKETRKFLRKKSGLSKALPLQPRIDIVFLALLCLECMLL